MTDELEGGTAILVLRGDGIVRHANAAAEALFARPLSSLIGRNFGLPLARRSRVRILGTSGPAEADLILRSGSWGDQPALLVSLRPVEAIPEATPIEPDRAAEERYMLVARAANDGFWDWDLNSETVHYSPRWKMLLGYGEEEIGATISEWFERVHGEDIERLRAAIGAYLGSDDPHFEHEYRMLHKSGTYRWVLCRGLAVRDEGGKAIRLAGSATDITQRRLAEEQLAHRAFYDPLTNLPNRGLFLDRLRHAVRREKRNPNYLFAVLFLDVDRFKRINDSLGHTVGDRMLVLVARRLELSLRPGDTVARLGGDEFTILLDDIHTVSDATHVADRIQDELAKPFQLTGHEVVTSASIGIALSAAGYDKPEDIVRDADTAMYRAKALGKARHALFDTGMHEQEVRLLKLEADLRRAIERDELLVHYQPIIALVSGRIVAVEALVRWKHPERGLVSPGEFIPLAEETGLIIPIGEFVMREACLQLRAWQLSMPGETDLAVSVNLSTRQFVLPDLVSRVEAVLSESDLDPRLLLLEITESVLMEKPEAVRNMLAQLRRIGVRISIDDFGTGYSSLAYLQRFPIDNLKIDRSFVSPLGEHGENSEIARTIVNIGHNLGMTVIAEGVETATQLAQVRELECEGAQGHLFSHPIDSEMTAELIAAGRSW
jgi:diguanylate cyclase (GGDEF)-like protein/PAS domain S-box-containing protein